MSYGKCPYCGADVVSRERAANGNSTCANGHVHPSRNTIPHGSDLVLPYQATPPREPTTPDTVRKIALDVEHSPDRLYRERAAAELRALADAMDAGLYALPPLVWCAHKTHGGYLESKRTPFGTFYRVFMQPVIGGSYRYWSSAYWEGQEPCETVAGAQAACQQHYEQQAALLSLTRYTGAPNGEAKRHGNPRGPADAIDYGTFAASHPDDHVPMTAEELANAEAYRRKRRRALRGEGEDARHE